MQIIKFIFLCSLNLVVLSGFIYYRFDVYPRLYFLWIVLIAVSFLWYNEKEQKKKDRIFEAIMTFFLIITFLSLFFLNSDKNQSGLYLQEDGTYSNIDPEVIKKEQDKYNTLLDNAILIGRWEVLEPENIDGVISSEDSGTMLVLNPLSLQGLSYLEDISIKYISIYCEDESYFMVQFDSDNQMSNIWEGRLRPTLGQSTLDSSYLSVDSSYVSFGPFDLFNTLSMDFLHNSYRRIE